MRFRFPARSAIISALLLLASAVHAQEFDSEYADIPTPSGVLIGAKGGMVLTSPRRILPSLQIGEASSTTGEISSQYAKTGYGNRYGLDFIIPFAEKVALATDIGMFTYSARYSGNPEDTTRAAVRLDVQMVQVGFGIQGSVYVDRDAFTRGGLRTVYLGAGMEIGAKIVANRMEAEFKDPAVEPQLAVGSFANNDPFRTLSGLRFSAGARAGLQDHLEFVLEGSYAFALNSVFSSAVIRDNDFTVDNLVVQIGAGYRF